MVDDLLMVSTGDNTSPAPDPPVTIYHHTKRLIEVGLIKKEKKGKYTCFSMGPVGIDLLAGSLNIMTEEYIQFILEKLSDHCHFPEILSKTENTVVIRVVCPKSDDIEIRISLGSFELNIPE